MLAIDQYKHLITPCKPFPPLNHCHQRKTPLHLRVKVEELTPALCIPRKGSQQVRKGVVTMPEVSAEVSFLAGLIVSILVFSILSRIYVDSMDRRRKDAETYETMKRRLRLVPDKKRKSQSGRQPL